VVADILNIAAIQQVGGPAAKLDPLLAATSWRSCCLVDSAITKHRNYVRFQAADLPGVIGHIGSCFGAAGVSLQSIVQFQSQGSGAEIVVITHEVQESNFRRALEMILLRAEVEAVVSCLRTL
jgi:homoserine dehydrogenase